MPPRTSRIRHSTERLGASPGRLDNVEAQLTRIEKDDGSGTVTFENKATLKVSSLGKIYFPAAGVTKGAVMRYYCRVWDVLKPHVTDRPLVLKRYPDGIAGPLFYQQNAGAHVPEGVRVEFVDTATEGKKPRITGGDLLTLLYTVQLGVIEVHPWLSTVNDVDAADRCLIDLDPPDDVPFAAAVTLAKAICTIAGECKLPMATKTSGSHGLHLVIPLPPGTSYETSQELAVLLSKAAERLHPDTATTERSIRARPKGAIYVDAMQNSRGKSMAGPYSLRPKEKATVSTPLRAEDLTTRLRTEAFTVKTVPARVMRVGDVWGGTLAKTPSARTIEGALQALTRVLSESGEPERKKSSRRSK